MKKLVAYNNVLDEWAEGMRGKMNCLIGNITVRISMRQVYSVFKVTGNI